MFLIPVVILSALVLILSGAVALLGYRLHAVKKSWGAASLPTVQAENTRAAVLRQKSARAVQLCVDIKRSLTHICTMIPSAIPGLSIERIHLLCADELKDKVTAVLNTFGNGFPDRFAQEMDRQDTDLLDQYIDQLAFIADDVKEIDITVGPVFKTWSDDSTITFDDYEQRLAAISRRLVELHKAVQSLLYSISKKSGIGENKLSVQKRIQQISMEVSDPEVRTAMANLETLAQQYYDKLNGQTKARMESYYLDTLELILRELGRAERAGENIRKRVELGTRVIRVLSGVIAAGQQTQCEINERNLEAEVVALERLAAMFGDVAP